MEERQITHFWVQSVTQMFELQRPKLSLNKYGLERKQSIVNSSWDKVKLKRGSILCGNPKAEYPSSTCIMT